MKFRLVLQPVIALIIAIRDGLKDAKAGKHPYFLALFTEPEHRQEMLKEGWKSVGRIYIFAIAIDLLSTSLSPSTSFIRMRRFW